MMKLMRVSSSPWLKLGLALSLVLPQITKAEAAYYSGASAPANVGADNSSMSAILSSLSSSVTNGGSLSELKKKLAETGKLLKLTSENAEKEDKNFKWAQDLTQISNLITGGLAIKQSKADGIVRADKAAANLFASMPRLSSGLNQALTNFSSSNLADSCSPGTALENVGTLARSFAPKLASGMDAMVAFFQQKGVRDGKAAKAKLLETYNQLAKNLNAVEPPKPASEVDVAKGNFSAAAQGAQLAATGKQLKDSIASKNKELLELFLNPEKGIIASAVDDEQDRQEITQKCLEAVNLAEENTAATSQLSVNSFSRLFQNCKKVQQGIVDDEQAGLTAITQRDGNSTVTNQMFTTWSNENSQLPVCNDESQQVVGTWQPALDAIPQWRQACATGNSSDIARNAGQFTQSYTQAVQATSQLLEADGSPKVACNADADFRASVRKAVQPVIQQLTQAAGQTTPPVTALQPPTQQRNQRQQGAHAGPGRLGT